MVHTDGDYTEKISKTITTVESSELAQKICQALGLDPDKVTGLKLEFKPGDYGYGVYVQLHVHADVVNFDNKISDDLLNLDWTLDSED